MGQARSGRDRAGCENRLSLPRGRSAGMACKRDIFHASIILESESRRLLAEVCPNASRQSFQMAVQVNHD